MTRGQPQSITIVVSKQVYNLGATTEEMVRRGLEASTTGDGLIAAALREAARANK
jgi:hypothetical protein